MKRSSSKPTGTPDPKKKKEANAGTSSGTNRLDAKTLEKSRKKDLIELLLKKEKIIQLQNEIIEAKDKTIEIMKEIQQLKESNARLLSELSKN